MNGDDIFTLNSQDLEAADEETANAALAARLSLYLRATYTASLNCWRGRDEHDTLRRTCHAAETLHRLHLDRESVEMARDAGSWLINLPIRDTLHDGERTFARIYPSRFKTLAYLGRFDDEQARKDFAELLQKEVGGMLRGVTESDVLTTCIVVDTLLTLESRDHTLRRAVCPDARYEAMLTTLERQLKAWRRPDTPARVRRVQLAEQALPVSAEALSSGEATAPRPRRVSKPLCEIDNPRDLSYTFGLLAQAKRLGELTDRQISAIVAYLIDSITEGERIRNTELAPRLYAALQLAEHYRDQPETRAAITGLLGELRHAYANTETPKRWDMTYHTLILRLLLTFYGERELAQSVTSWFLRREEQRRTVERSALEVEMSHVIRERLRIDLGEYTELSGGYTGDQVFRVPFTYVYPTPGVDAANGIRGLRVGLNGPHEASVIIKRSTGDSFSVATKNYQRLPQSLRELFVRQPEESQVYKAGLSSAYYLVMEDLADMATFEDLLNVFDQRAMSDQHLRLLRAAASLICEASFSLFREPSSGALTGFPGTQLARLYMAPIESKLTRAVTRIPWLKNPLEGYYIGEQRFRGLDYYLTALTRHATELQPKRLGLTHGDLHSRNIMLDAACAHLKLIDLDKLSWRGDYIADLGNLLADVLVFRRVAEAERDFRLPREEIIFVTNARVGTAENAVRYPALGRPATVALQRHMLEAIGRFANEIGDTRWKERLWLACATGLFVRLAFQTQKEPAAALYGEAIRLLHELIRRLEQGQELPDVLVPQIWPASISGIGLVDSAGEPPEWISRNAHLRAVFDGLRELGLHAEIDREAVSFTAQTQTMRLGDNPIVAKLIPPRREGIGRLLLPSQNGRPLPETNLDVVQSNAPNDAFGTIVILTPDMNVASVLLLARTCVFGAAVRATPSGRSPRK